MALDDEVVRRAGFSRSKIAFLRDLASGVVEERLPLDRLHEEDAQTVMQQLVAVKGNRRVDRRSLPDVPSQAARHLSADDLGLVKAAQRAYGLRQRADRKKLLKMAEAWRPYR